jgi:lipopolysaccharide export LptBFGC system permease protein LptF
MWRIRNRTDMSLYDLWANWRYSIPISFFFFFCHAFPFLFLIQKSSNSWFLVTFLLGWPTKDHLFIICRVIIQIHHVKKENNLFYSILSFIPDFFNHNKRRRQNNKYSLTIYALLFDIFDCRLTMFVITEQQCQRFPSYMLINKKM